MGQPFDLGTSIDPTVLLLSLSLPSVPLGPTFSVSNLPPPPSMAIKRSSHRADPRAFRSPNYSTSTMRAKGDNAILVCCDECSRQFLPNHNPDLVKWHRSVDLAVTTPFQPDTCDVCGKELSFLNPNPKDRDYTCYRCTTMFARGDRLLAHSAQHTLKKAFACPVCNATFSRKNRLSTHMMLAHQASMGEVYHCAHCNMEFEHASRLRTHAKVCMCG